MNSAKHAVPDTNSNPTRWLGPMCGLGRGCQFPRTNVCGAACSVTIGRPLRLYVLLNSMMLFILTCHMALLVPSPMTDMSRAYLGALFGTYVMVFMVDIILQWTGDPYPDTPVLLFDVMGVILFTGAGIWLHVLYTVEAFWALLVSRALCAAAVFTLAIDALYIFAW